MVSCAEALAGGVTGGVTVVTVTADEQEGRTVFASALLSFSIFSFFLPLGGLLISPFEWGNATKQVKAP